MNSVGQTLTSGVGTVYPSGAPEFTPVFSGVCVTRSLALCVCFVDRCLSFFFWPLCCLFFDIRILITPLVSSNSSYYMYEKLFLFINHYLSQDYFYVPLSSEQICDVSSRLMFSRFTSHIEENNCLIYKLSF